MRFSLLQKIREIRDENRKNSSKLTYTWSWIGQYAAKLMLCRKWISQIFGFTSVSSYFQVTWNSRNLSVKSYDLERGLDFEIMFKCMSGLTTENAKFIKPLKEKMSYDNSFDSCNSSGFTKQISYEPYKLKIFESKIVKTE